MLKINISYKNAYLKIHTTKYEKYTKWQGALQQQECLYMQPLMW